jgi:ADP-heptose:LPS heptosyltransferase
VAPALKLKAIGSGRLPVSNGDRGVVRLLLEGQGISTSDRVAVVHVGAKRRANRWFEGRFAAVADYTRLRYGIRTVLTGAPSERELMEDVRRRMKTRPVLLCGEVTLLQLAALMERATLYIGNDTGPMHIAAMMGTPAVAIFSARDFPSQWYPHGTGHIVLRKDVPCSPCFKDVCDQDLLCLDLIRLDEVLAAVDAQLAAADIPVAGSSKTSQGQFAILPVAGQPWDRSSR